VKLSHHGYLSQPKMKIFATATPAYNALPVVAIFSKYLRKHKLDKKNLKQFKEEENEVIGKI